MFKAHIKLNVLKELNKNSLAGYDLIKYLKEFGQKTSPGYIYPLLNDLKKKGFISLKHDGRRKIYSLTNKGKKLLAELESNKQEMIKKMTKVLSSITDKKEVKSVIDSKVNFHKNKELLKGSDLLERFHKEFFSTYRESNEEKRKKIRKIVEDSIIKIKKCR